MSKWLVVLLIVIASEAVAAVVTPPDPISQYLGWAVLAGLTLGAYWAWSAFRRRSPRR